jgi:AIR carboxylase
MPKTSPLVAVIMGSSSDWETMSVCVKTLDQLGIANQAHVLSAHRTPDATAKFAREAADRGIRVMIAAAGGAAHLALYLVAGARGSGSVVGLARFGLAPFDCANAGRHSRWHTRHWLRGREECGALGCSYSRTFRQEDSPKSSGVSQKAD